MSNSNLVDYTCISPNSTNPRQDSIRKITIHHMAGNLTVEKCGEIFAPTRREASANYGIGTDGRVGLYVDEENRAWTSSNANNDNQAITIEVANDGGEETGWHVSDVAFNKLIDLCVDICQRNGINGLNYTGDTSGNLTRHNMFTATGCPGQYLQSRFPDIEQIVNERLGISHVEENNSDTNSTTSPEVNTKYHEGDVVTYSKIYASSMSDVELSPLNTVGTITNVIPEARNPYLLNGGTGWINDDCIIDNSNPVEEPVVVVNPISSTQYHEGDHVFYNGIYSSSTSGERLNPTYTDGTITHVEDGAPNPYLIDGGTGWINDSCITNGDTSETEVASEPSDGRLSPEQVAYEICFGYNRWGNGDERVNNLLAEGYDPEEVRRYVNANFGL